MLLRVARTSVALGLLVASTVHADLLEDFESLAVGQLSGQGGWTATSSVNVVRDINTDNLLMHFPNPNASAYLPLGALAIPDEQVGTLFFRFQVDGNVLDHTLGLADEPNPGSWSEYEPTTRLFPDGISDLKAQGRNGGTYDDMTLNGGANGLQPDTWYHLWMVNDNLADTTDFYIQGGAITTQRLVAEDFDFRNGTVDPLITFLVRTGGAATSSLFVDDIHVWSGQNLTSPIGDPAAGAVVIDTSDPGNRTLIGLNPPQLFDFAGQRLTDTHASMPANNMPERTFDGDWNQTGAGAWTSGFFSGQLWMMYRQTDDPTFLNAAKTRTADIEGQEYNGGNHDVGFRVFNSFGQGYKSLPDGDPDKADYLSRILIAADTLSGRFRPAYQAIDSWGGNQVIIDNMMNLELLFWAADHTTDPQDAQDWYDIAFAHAMTTAAEHIRPDGSSYHVVQFDPDTGEVVDKRTAQGYADESTWSRGEAWGIYGFTMAYRYTNETTFLDTAVAMAEYWLGHLPVDGVVPYDFDDPNPDVPLDSSATAIAADALLELMGYVGPTDADRYFDAAESMLGGLSSLDILTNDLDYDSILREGSIAKNVHHMGLTYGDYYFLEALQRYQSIIDIPGDADGDGDVDLDDYNILSGNMYTAVAGGAADGDFNDDGFVDFEDFVIQSLNFGDWPSAEETIGNLVPEPGSAAILVLMTVTLLTRAGRRSAFHPISKEHCRCSV